MIERTDHDKRVCLAVLEALEEREGSAFDGLAWADEVERNQEAVDLTFRSTKTRFALEHTRIESFEGQIEHFHQTQGWVRALRSQLEGALPGPGHYVISFAAGAAAGNKPTPESIEALVQWVRSRAPSLELGSPETAPRHFVCEKPRGVSFEITLTRWPRLDGEVHFSDWVPDDLEGRRRFRIRQALEAKLPKLAAAARSGVTSILVLESDDISLANAWNVASAFADELGRLQGQVPDQAWLVETDADPWHVWELKGGPQIFGANLREGHLEIDSGTRQALLLKWSLRLRQGRWIRYSRWETEQALESPPDFSRALAWMWDAWQLARSHDPDWGLRVDDAHIRRLRETAEVLGRLGRPS
jgi:hypothetical protein